ncbi:MAG: AzlD domain-containing protein [Firmicutes bacterium]|nr:AzlD domain-containing protein [Bacillota bacterium]
MLVILGMALVTYLTRVSLLVLVGRVSLPAPLMAALRYIPIGIITALVVPAILVVGGKIDVSPANLYIPAALASALIAAKWKNILLAMCGGVAVVVIMRLALSPA